MFPLVDAIPVRVHPHEGVAFVPIKSMDNQVIFLESLCLGI